MGINRSNSLFRRRTAERKARNRQANDIAKNSDRWDSGVAEQIAVREAVLSLPKQQRTVIILRYLNDMSIHETAEVMGVSEGAVKALSHKATTRLRGQVDLSEVEDV